MPGIRVFAQGHDPRSPLSAPQDMSFYFTGTVRAPNLETLRFCAVAAQLTSMGELWTRPSGCWRFAGSRPVRRRVRVRSWSCATFPRSFQIRRWSLSTHWQGKSFSKRIGKVSSLRAKCSSSVSPWPPRLRPLPRFPDGATCADLSAHPHSRHRQAMGPARRRRP